MTLRKLKINKFGHYLIAYNNKMYYIIKSLHLSCFYSLYPTGPEASWVQITSPGNATEIYMNGHFYFAKVFMSALKVCFYLVSLFVCVSDFFPCIWCTLSFEQNSTRVSSIKRCEQDNCRILLEVFWVSGFFGCKSQISKFYISLFMFFALCRFIYSDRNLTSVQQPCIL